MVITRAQWGATHGRGQPVAGPLSHVVVHHSAGPLAYADAAAEAHELRSMEHYHAVGRGWQGIAYSFVVFPSGRVYEGRGWGRSGAHTAGFNRTAMGLCLAGNGEAQPAPPRAWAAAATLIEAGVRHGHLTPRPAVTGHRDHAATACPGARNTSHLHLLRDIEAVGTTKENDVPLTDADMDRIEGVLRRVLAEAVGPGQRTWSGTVSATLEGLQRTFNIADATARRLEVVYAEVAAARRLLAGLTGRPGVAADAAPTQVLPPRRSRT